MVKCHRPCSPFFMGRNGYRMKNAYNSIRRFISNYPIILFILITFIGGALFVPRFVSEYNIKNLCLQLCDLLVVACGYTFVELNAGTDLSATSVLCVGSILGGYVMAVPMGAHPVLGMLLGILTMVGVGMLFGTVNGLAVTRLKMPSFIASMATMLIGAAFSAWFAAAVVGKTSIGGLPKIFTMLGGSGDYFVIPLIITAIMWFIGDFLLTKTKFGRDLYSVGTNPKCAFISGINVRRTVFLAFLISSIYASVECLILTARNMAGMSSLGATSFLNIVSAVVIGGTSVTGGFGGVRQTFFGAVFIVLINNVMNMYGVEWYTIMLMQGFLILIATIVDFMVKNSRNRVKRA